MWVWRSLASEQASELPRSALTPLGCRCRKDEKGLGDASRRTESDATQWGRRPPTAPEEFVRDSRGEAFELNSDSSELDAAAWRLVPYKAGKEPNSPNLQLCVPAAVDVSPVQQVVIVDAAASSSDPRTPASPERRGHAFKSARDAIRTLSHKGGGTFWFRVPVADARLRKDTQENLLCTPAPAAWPHSVVGAMLGAVLRVQVSVDGASSVSRASTALPSVNDRDESRPVVVAGDGFELTIVQRGGSLLDPAKLHGKNDEGIGQELENWIRRTRTKPGTWRLLFVSTEPNPAVETSPLIGQLSSFQPPRTGILSRIGRQIGDIVLATSAEIEFSIDPFEVSYGEAHLDSLRRMIAEEISNVLGILNEQVMCGDFLMKSHVPKRKHVRRDSLVLQVSILHQGMVEVARGKEMPRRKPAAPMAKGAQVSKGALSETKTSLFDDLVITSRKSLKMSKSSADFTKKSAAVPTNAKKSVNVERTEATFKEAETTMNHLSQVMSPKKSRQGLSKSASSPDFSKGKTDGRVSDSLLTVLSLSGQGSPPDQLLKLLITVLADQKHPLRKHPEIFPMLSKVSRNSVVVGAPLLVSQDIIDPDQIAESLRSMMKPKKAKRNETDLDNTMLSNLSSMRTDILNLYTTPGGDSVMAMQKLMELSPKDLLEAAEGAFSQIPLLISCLDAMIQKTKSDVDWCLRLRLHHGIDRVSFTMRRFNSNRELVYRCFEVLNNMTLHDVGSVDEILRLLLAPEFLNSLQNFPNDRPMQYCGCLILKRMYLRARENALAGVRIITLGTGLDELWTFKGLERVLLVMAQFAEDPAVQLECCILLASLGEMLYNNGYAVQVFKLLEVAMRKHAARSDILAQGILIIARLGPSFLAVEHRGIRTIVEAMACHRSDKELQGVAVRALFNLSKDESSIGASRAGGSVGAIFAGMTAHHSHAQVVQEGTRALEKHCPRAVAAIARLCGDIVGVLPPVVWAAGPQNPTSTTQVEFNLDDIQNAGWDARRIEAFMGDLSPTNKDRPDAQDDERDAEAQRLEVPAGFRMKGLREDTDASDRRWMGVGTVKVKMAPRANPAHNVGEKDLQALMRQGCDASVLRPPGPTQPQLKGLCEVLKAGIGPKKFGTQDGELIALMLGHFAWYSAANAKTIVKEGGHTALIQWLASDRFKGNVNPQDDALAYPMQRACLSALSCLCRHGDEPVAAALKAGADLTAISYAKHGDQAIRISAIRLLARLIPHAAKKSPNKEPLPWEDILEPIVIPGMGEGLEKKSGMRSKNDEILRTAATACALEGILDGWLTKEGVPVQQLAKALLIALEEATDIDSPAAALPALIAVNRMASSDDESEDAAVLAITSQEALVPLLISWLPKATVDGASPAAKAAGLSAAGTLRTLSEESRGDALGGGELQSLLRYGTLVSAEPALRQACDSALSFAVARESDASLLVQLLDGRLRTAVEERMADLDVVIVVAQRAAALLKQSTNQASDILLASLEQLEPLVPKDTKGSKDLKLVLEELVVLCGGRPGPITLEQEEGSDEPQSPQSPKGGGLGGTIKSTLG
eukprot:TRINITY_DN31845_c0_g1_i1.p1 TRINITY_DN31845_c0_g1~~TRINITY_DN31845_c0_g1_i1.p1  ORF type:complete len:1552 (+),score=289.47 TRINITY_DN31845_c0_g1_i1:117-4772(+)